MLLVTLKRSKPLPQKVKLAVGSLPIEPASRVVTLALSSEYVSLLSL